MSPQTFSQRGRRGVKLFLLPSFILAVCVTALVFTARSGAQEREFKNTARSHLPVKVKLKNEQAFKKLDNKRWARDFEVEVKNTGTKPIYYLYVVVVMPEVIVAGHPLSLRTKYGRKELAFFETPLQPDDAPILPGETIILKIPENQVKAYEHNRDEQGRPDPKKVELWMQIINFGDGTGFRGTEGTFERARPRSQKAPPPDRRAGACVPAPAARAAAPPAKLRTTFSPTTPASFLRVNFSPPDVPALDAPSSLPNPVSFQSNFCGCQNDGNCM